MNVRSVVIFYFSGTGNTKRVLHLLTRELGRSDVKVELISIEDQLKKDFIFPDQDKYDLIGISYPIYGFGTPAIVERFISRFDKGIGKPLFILKTGADYISINDNASTNLIGVLEELGYNVFYDRIIVMPSNWIVKYADALAKQLDDCAEKKVIHMCDDLFNLRRRRYKTGGFIKLLSLGIAHLEKNYGSGQFGSSLMSSGSCNLCGICVRNCPVGNIDFLDKGVKFGSECIWCMRCVYNCPMKAIKSRGLNFCIIKEGYDIEKILKDDSIGREYVTADTRGYFRHFIKYFNDDSL